MSRQNGSPSCLYFAHQQFFHRVTERCCRSRLAAYFGSVPRSVYMPSQVQQRILLYDQSLRYRTRLGGGANIAWSFSKTAPFLNVG